MTKGLRHGDVGKLIKYNNILVCNAYMWCVVVALVEMITYNYLGITVGLF